MFVYCPQSLEIKTKLRFKDCFLGVHLLKFAWWCYVPTCKPNMRIFHTSTHNHAQMYCKSPFNLAFIGEFEKLEEVQIAILSLYHNQVMKNADAIAEQDGPTAFRRLLSLGRLLGPRGPWWNNQSLTGAGPASASECCVPATINRPG